MDELEALRVRLARERAARKEAERIAEEKTRALYDTNARLSQLNEHLQELVDARTVDLLEARDKAVAASSAKSTFVANMSHELRTPLNAVIGYSEMILEDGLTSDPVIVADVKKIHDAGKHLLTLVNDLLDLAKVESGKMSVFRERVDVVALVGEVVDTLRPLREPQRTSLVVVTGDDVGVLHTDAMRLRQILWNLLSNAIKFTPGGDVSLRVERDAELGRVVFEIQDTGIGIARDQLDKLFVPFMQADPSASRTFGGTGLGLALAQRFCSMLGGAITVRSEEHRGSTFRFWLGDLPPLDILADPRDAITPALVGADPAAMPRRPSPPRDASAARRT